MISRIVIHCSASPNGQPFTIEDIDEWHKERGFSRSTEWSDKYSPNLKHVGYHYVIHTDGHILPGRHVSEVGAHVKGYNKTSIGVCVIGTDKFRVQQWWGLWDIISFLMQLYPLAEVLGHRDLPDVKKLCPGFDVAAWLSDRDSVIRNHTWTPS